MSIGSQDTNPGDESPVEHMHSPYIPEHPGSIPYDNDVTVGEQYVEFFKGTMPLILAVPHGGKDDLNVIPDRTAGCFNGACF